MKKIGLLILVTITLSSCSVKQVHETGEGIALHVKLEEQSPSFDELFSKAQVIPLATEDSCLLMGIDKIAIDKDSIYIFDYFKPALYIFDGQGNFKGNIARKGNGPGEYDSLSDFIIDKQNRRIYLLSPYGTLLEYDMKGNFIDKKVLPVKPNYYSVALTEDKSYLVCWSCVEQEEDGISIIDLNSMSLVNSYWNNDRMLDMGLVYPFYEYNGDVYFGTAYQNKVYKLDENQMSCSYQWDFGKEGIDEKKLDAYLQIENDGERNQRILQDLEDGTLPFAMEQHQQNSRYYYVALRPGFGPNRPFINVFYEKKTNRTFTFEELKEGIPIQPLLFTDDYLVSVLSYEKLPMYRKILEEKEFQTIASMKEDDNVCLVKFYFNN